MSSVAYFADPTIQFTDFAQVWRRFRREDPAFDDIEVRLEGGLVDAGRRYQVQRKPTCRVVPRR